MLMLTKRERERERERNSFLLACKINDERINTSYESSYHRDPRVGRSRRKAFSHFFFKSSFRHFFVPYFSALETRV